MAIIYYFVSIADGSVVSIVDGNVISIADGNVISMVDGNVVSIADGNVVATADDNIGNICEPITVSMCKDIGYTMTPFPNSLGHTSQDEAGLEVHQFFPISNCEMQCTFEGLSLCFVCSKM